MHYSVLLITIVRFRVTTVQETSGFVDSWYHPPSVVQCGTAAHWNEQCYVTETTIHTNRILCNSLFAIGSLKHSNQTRQELNWMASIKHW